jgi:glycosyltransferase involved in cell wall biosynthesis
MRALLKGTEKVSCALADRVVCIGPSLRRVALSEGLVSASRSMVIGGGGNGFDIERAFSPEAHRGRTAALREELGLPGEAKVVGFVGRLVRDKGVAELAEAWSALRERFKEARCLIVGPFEPEDPVPAEVRRALIEDPRVILVGETEEVAPYYGLMDVLALPTYREGFPNVPMEAAAMRVPVVATRIPGCTDAVVDGQTGALVPVRDAGALAEALGAYLADPEEAAAHGVAGRARVAAEFTKERILGGQLALYEELLGASPGAGGGR